MPPLFSVRSNVVNLAARTVTPAEVRVVDGKIAAIQPLPDGEAVEGYLVPGFIDAHVHVESSMLVPTEFARAAVVHGTVGSVSDPHEIGNVLGVAGVEYMLAQGDQTPFKFCFGAPSCVPATTFETAGATVTVAEVEALLDDPRIGYLSEMMNFPGVLHGDPECLAKIKASLDRGKPVDGHAPGLRGEQAAKYVAAGMTTDHECFTIDEARDKLAAGCKISIRDGSAARNFDALAPLIAEHPGMVMLCSDDKHPDELEVGHINLLLRRAVAAGADAFHALRAACQTPVEHYSLPIGLMRVGDPADFVEIDSLTAFNVRRTWIDGVLVAENGKTMLPRIEPAVANNFVAREVRAEELALPAEGVSQLRVIEAIEGQLITNSLNTKPKVHAGHVVSDVANDVLKLVVVNRYADAAPAIAFIKNFGLQRGAIASSVAHDSHNVIAVGVDDTDISTAMSLVMENQGGLSAASHKDGVAEALPLPVAGLMATGTCQEVGAAYGKLDKLAKAWGSPLRAPYMTLSFMALLVIPSLKLSDKGLFDGDRFEFVSLTR
ncbi:adenine deaminase [Botrimarina mediterranea]|uniref:Adenine deaminase n=1 Tax=Botrimarina mediterranea TaxID=2528022 RepID=A0A518K6Y2_9BACT|nr:adenine deaminase [Botrimarina mediterranea]QDV73562.1 Adenine deaminase [Botrimarina mediterranea]QDV78153.1 Adenine deaminase [Planctomycetes bacterium K2D]